ncbi:MAG: hypothetical protein J5965_04015 [Aeriscardovia sp.]|nr:hypothetical protein [Aeriscardovia sp.]
MDDVIGIILLVVTIIVSLPVVGMMSLFAVLWIMDWRQERRFKKFQNGLSKEDWKNGEKEEYKHWLGY